MDNLKVGLAAVVGVASPSTNWFVTDAEPVLRLVLLAGQIGVAVLTSIYIYRKIKSKSK